MNFSGESYRNSEYRNYVSGTPYYQEHEESDEENKKDDDTATNLAIQVALLSSSIF